MVSRKDDTFTDEIRPENRPRCFSENLPPEAIEARKERKRERAYEVYFECDRCGYEPSKKAVDNTPAELVVKLRCPKCQGYTIVSGFRLKRRKKIGVASIIGKFLRSSFLERVK